MSEAPFRTRRGAKGPRPSAAVIALSAHLAALGAASTAHAQSTPDCNHNGVDDAIDIATGTSDDCNSNQVPDECEDGSVKVSTGEMGPFYWQFPAIGTLPNLELATTPVRIRVRAKGDLDAPTEFITLKVNGTTVANFFFTVGPDCDHAGVEELTLSATVWNMLIGSSDDAEVRIVASPLVEPDCVVPPRDPLPGQCEVSVEYGGMRYDCNGNGEPDICDIANGAVDCNANGWIDACELASGAIPD